MEELLKLITDGADLSKIKTQAETVSKSYEEMAYKVNNSVIEIAKAKETADKFRETNIKLAKAYKNAFGDEIDFDKFDDVEFVNNVKDKMKSGNATLDALDAKYKEEIESNKALISNLTEEKSALEKEKEAMARDFIVKTTVSEAINSLPYQFIDPALRGTFETSLLENIEVKDGVVIPMELKDGVRIPMYKDGKALTMKDLALIKSEEKSVFFKSTTANGDGGLGGGNGSFKGKDYKDMTPAEKYDYTKAQQGKKD